jgi:hypothetical protein
MINCLASFLKRFLSRFLYYLVAVSRFFLECCVNQQPSLSQTKQRFLLLYSLAVILKGQR